MLDETWPKGHVYQHEVQTNLWVESSLLLLFYFENGQKAVDPVWVVNWGKIFFSQMINRPSCHSCKYSNLDRPGDFTIADFWDDKKNRPDLYSCEGTSLLMVNTNMGLGLVINFTILLICGR